MKKELEFKEKFWRAMTITLSIFTIIILIALVSKDSKLKVANLKLQSTTDSFTIEKDKNNELYIRQAQVIATQKQAIEAGLVDKAELKAQNIKQLQALFNYSQTFKALNLQAPFKDPEIITRIDTVTNQDTQSFLRVPEQFTFKDDWIHVSGIVHRTGVELGTIQTELNGSIKVGKQKTGFMKREPVVTFKTDNPYVTTIRFNNVIVQDNAFYNKFLFRVVECGGSFLVGYYFGNK